VSEQQKAHGLGPHVVGLRVVVRRVVRGETGPSGGPALTDVLGVCTAWGDGVCVVMPESGVSLTIPLADIVAGKPVPPRASIRMRIPAHDAELHVGSLWSTLETEPLGGWLLRAAPPDGGRLRRRANSVLAMRDPGLPLDEALEAVRTFYAARDQRPLAQVEAGSELEIALRERGWTPLPDGEAAFELAAVPHVLRRLRHVSGPVALEEEAGHAVARVGSSSGRAVVDRDWLGLHGLYVDPAARRTGVAQALIAELLEWGASQGASTAWLHVETDNLPGLALYAKLGFELHHTCRYLQEPAAS
jgi:ribosomal protein S18 acetylase RimI-like enzyme